MAQAHRRLKVGGVTHEPPEAVRSQLGDSVLRSLFSKLTQCSAETRLTH